MPLTIRVGTLTAYFAAPLRASGEFERPPSDDEVRARVLAWREWVGDGLRRLGHAKAPLDWDEGAHAVAHETRLDADDLRALKLRLAYSGDAAFLPPERLPKHPERDPRWIELAGRDFDGSEYDQVLVPELWLPGDSEFTFPCPYPDGHEVATGWLAALRRQLAQACGKLLGGAPGDCEAWARESPVDAPLRARARRAAGALWCAATDADSRRVPMLIHS